MPEVPAGWLLAGAALVFITFLLFRARVPLGVPGAVARDAAKRIAAAKVRARDATRSAADRASDWCEAGTAALDELRRPSRAASYALRASRVDPEHTEAVKLLARALVRARRLPALERVLWRRLDGARGPAWEAALDELLALYDGPMRRPERARVLRKLGRG